MKQPDKKASQYYAWLKSYIRNYFPEIALLSVISVGTVCFELLEPWPIKILVDSVFGHVRAPLLLAHLDKSNLLLAVSLSFIVIYALESIISLLQSVYLHKLMYLFDLKIMSELFNKIQNLPLRFLDHEQTGDYAYRLNSESGDVSQLIFDVTNKFLSSGLLIIGLLIVMARIDLPLALIALCVIPLLYISIRRFTPRIEEQSQKVEESNSDLYSYTTEALENVQLTQTFNNQKRQLGLIERLLKRNFVYQMKSLITNEKYSLVNDTIATVAMSVLVILGAERVYSHGLTVGDLLIFLTYLSYLYNPLQTISDSIADTRSYFAASKRVFEIYNYNQPIPEVANPRLLKNIHGKITFHDVSASYGRHGVLHNIDLTIEPGEKVGVIGRSGEGKTTLFNLLPRFYEYQKGTISIDDIPIDQVSLTNLRDQFAIVSQDAPLLNTSIADNLKIAQNSTSISHQDIEQALRDANAYEFIHQLPKGLKTNVGEHSRLLSGGQRQRIAIARAFLKNAPIVLLDEPSTGLDEESVSVILEALQRLMAQRTTLIISHSLEILKNTDTIYLLDKGHIAAKTTYQSLISDYTYSRESTPNELAIFRESMFDQVRSKPLQ